MDTQPNKMDLSTMAMNSTLLFMLSSSTSTTSTTTTSSLPSSVTSTSTTTTTTTRSTSRSHRPEEKEELYRVITVAIVSMGLLLMFVLTCYIIRENRRELRRRRNRKKQVQKELDGDIPPTYSQIVLRKEPPEYNESVMQEINPEANPHWSEDYENVLQVHPEVGEAVATKVKSQAHGFYYSVANRNSDPVLRQDFMIAAGIVEGGGLNLAPNFEPNAQNTRRNQDQNQIQRSGSHPTFVLGADP